MGMFEGLLKKKKSKPEETKLDFPPSSETTKNTLHNIHEVWYKTKVVLDGGWASEVVIGGGAIRDLFFDRKPRDIDLYLIPSSVWWRHRASDQERVIGILQEMQRKLDQAFSLAPAWNARRSHMESFVQCEKPCSVLKLGEATYNGTSRYLQFMIPKGNSPQEVVDRFDLDISQFAYDGEKFYTGTGLDTQSVIRAVRGEGPVKLVNPVTTKNRLTKFSRRFGCDIEPAKKQMIEFLKSETNWNGDMDMGFCHKVDNPLYDFYGEGSS